MPGPVERLEGRGSRHLLLLACSIEGLRNLAELQCRGYRRDGTRKPRITKRDLRSLSGGIIGLSGCLGGEIPRVILERGREAAWRCTVEYTELFEPGCFFLEVQQAGFEGQPEVNEALRRLGREQGLELVATNDVHYLFADDFLAHEVLMAMNQGVTLGEPGFRTGLDTLSERIEQLRGAGGPPGD